MLALGRFELKLCACGFHEALTSDPTNHFTFDERVCPVCRGGARYERKRAREDDEVRTKLGDKSPTDPTDGRRIYTRLMSPDEVEEVRHRRSSRGGPPRTGG